MKKLVLLPFVLASSIFASSDQLTIREDKSFSKEVVSNVVSAGFIINLKDASLDSLNKRINNIIAHMKKYKGCENDGYGISSEYSLNQTDKNKKETLSYNSELEFQCQFKNVSKFSNILKSLEKEKIKVDNIHYDTSDKVKLKALKDLTNLAYSYPVKKSKELSKKLGMSCHLLKSSVGDVFVKSYSKNNISMPKNSKHKVMLKAHYFYGCK